MATTSNKSVNTQTLSITSAQEKDWALLYTYSKKIDYHNLAYSLIGAAVGTAQHEQVRLITENWMTEQKRKWINDRALEKLVKRLEKIRPMLWFILSISPDRASFISKLLVTPTTLYVLSDDNADDICVITSEPTTANIYEYCKLYTEVLVAGFDSYEFVVYGENEVDENHYCVKLTKEEWYA